jgi:UDP-N-acetylmuramate--alanine ligase
VNQLTSEELQKFLANPSCVYLIGAGGCGMSGLGHLLLDLGHRVSGSDLVWSEELSKLSQRGAQVHVGHDANQLVRAEPRLVIYSPAVRLDNPELNAARALGLPIVRRPVVLASLLNGQRGICIAGMHGKTTTTSLLAFVLDRLGAAPGYAVGGLVPQMERHARLSTAENSWFVAETDESDGTLVEFRPEYSIVLNVDEEHLDYYANWESICHQFQQFAQQTSKEVIFCADDRRLSELYARHPRATSFGFHPLATYRIDKLKCSARGSTFEVWNDRSLVGSFTLGLCGDKNASNACAAIALLHRIGFAAGPIAAALEQFSGAARRQEVLFCDDRFRVYDDYGHHPTEIEATLRAIKSLPHRRLLVAFQPHRFTRTKHLMDRFATCFHQADRLWLTEVYAASEAEIPGVNAEKLADAIRGEGQAVELVESLGRLGAAIKDALLPGDIVLFLGAGDITKVAHEFAAGLDQHVMQPKEELYAAMAACLSRDSVLKQDEPLARRTTLRVGGRADFYFEPASEADLGRGLQFCAANKVPFTILGRGSNLLVKDGGIRGVVICLGHPNFSRLEIRGAQLHCGAGVKLKTVAVEARRNGLAGLEFLEGIPGSVGGSLRMNAGAMGSWMFEVVESVRFMDYSGQVNERPASEIYVEYRGCPLFKDHIALGAVLKGTPADTQTIAQRMDTYSHKRWESQPAAPSAGCIFKNPKTIPAGKLIDELGLKGTRVGAAVVSDVHGNFIVNEGGASAQDVLNLIEVIKQRVKAARGIDLETEVQIIGE